MLRDIILIMIIIINTLVEYLYLYLLFIMRSSNLYKVDTYRILNLSYTEIIQ
jgi:hypothetical protein